MPTPVQIISTHHKCNIIGVLDELLFLCGQSGILEGTGLAAFVIKVVFQAVKGDLGIVIIDLFLRPLLF